MFFLIGVTPIYIVISFFINHTFILTFPFIFVIVLLFSCCPSLIFMSLNISSGMKIIKIFEFDNHFVVANKFNIFFFLNFVLNILYNLIVSLYLEVETEGYKWKKNNRIRVKIEYYLN